MAWILAVVILLVIIAVWFGVNQAGRKRVESRHEGDIERALSDENEPIPSSHLITDDERPVGDTPEAHDEVNPRDLPKDNPARQEAERQAEGDGETTGDRVGDSRAE